MFKKTKESTTSVSRHFPFTNTPGFVGELLKSIRSEDFTSFCDNYEKKHNITIEQKGVLDLEKCHLTITVSSSLTNEIGSAAKTAVALSGLAGELFKTIKSLMPSDS